MNRREILRQAFLPGRHEPWPIGQRLRWIYIVRMWMLPMTILGNMALWFQLRDDPQAHREVADLFIFTNNGLLLLALVLTAVFMRRPGPACIAVMIFGAMVEQLTAVIWIQMTGTVTSYFIGTLGVLAFVYRILGNYWAGLAAFATGAVGLVCAYLLEEAGVLPRSSLFISDVGSNLLPEVYRSTAFMSVCLAGMAGWIGSNLLGRALDRSKADLADARAELAAVVDEARLGRLSGVRFGRYQLGELLGRGGMGEVYEARVEGDRPVAIKVLHHHLGAETTARSRFRREAELVRLLPVEVAARVLEVGTTPDGADYIAMERLPGEDLGATLRRRGRLEPGEVVAVISAIARAVGEAHEAGIVHRDLKPSNVFLIDGRFDDVRVLDFGIARLYEASASVTLTETSVILGSPGYMPPEQAVGDHDAVGPAADIFALGAIAYRAITGLPAFPSRSAAAAIHEAIHHTPARPTSLVPDLPPGVDQVLAVALAKNAKDRYARATDLSDDLAAALGGDSLSERITPARPRTPNPEAGVPTLSEAGRPSRLPK